MLTATGCSLQSPNKLDSGAASSSMLSDYRSEGISVASIKCPERVELKKNMIFTCRVYGIDKSNAPVRVQEINNQGAVKTVDDLIRTEEIEQQTLNNITPVIKQSIQKIVCPDVALSERGSVFVCHATLQNKKNISISVHLRNKKSGTKYKILP